MKKTTKVAITVIVIVEHEKRMPLGEVERIASDAVHCGGRIGSGQDGGFSAKEFERRIEVVSN